LHGKPKEKGNGAHTSAGASNVQGGKGKKGRKEKGRVQPKPKASCALTATKGGKRGEPGVETVFQLKRRGGKAKQLEFRRPDGGGKKRRKNTTPTRPAGETRKGRDMKKPKGKAKVRRVSPHTRGRLFFVELKGDGGRGKKRAGRGSRTGASGRWECTGGKGKRINHCPENGRRGRLIQGGGGLNKATPGLCKKQGEREKGGTRRDISPAPPSKERRTGFGKG